MHFHRMFSYCNYLSLSCNSIYSIHLTFYSSCLSSIISSLFILFILFIFYELFFYNTSFALHPIIFYDLIFVSALHPIIYSLFGLNLMLCFIIICFMLYLLLWINDNIIENSFSFTRTEQFLLVYAIKLIILSEFMLFFACFWCMIDFRLILNTYSLFFCFPLLSSNLFAIPYTNVIILFFSSLPIQSASIFYKIGLFNICIEQLSQTISCGIVFLVLQIKEFIYAYICMSDSIIGSIFYFTTGLHGAHVYFGLLSFFIIYMLMLFCFCHILYIINYFNFAIIFYVFNFLPTFYSSCYISFYSSYFYSFFYSFYSFYFILFYKLHLIYYSFLLSASSSYISPYYIEFSHSLFISSLYWHFVDIIWFLVFLLYFI